MLLPTLLSRDCFFNGAFVDGRSRKLRTISEREKYDQKLRSTLATSKMSSQKIYIFFHGVFPSSSSFCLSSLSLLLLHRLMLTSSSSSSSRTSWLSWIRQSPALRRLPHLSPSSRLILLVSSSGTCSSRAGCTTTYNPIKHFRYLEPQKRRFKNFLKD